VSDDEALRAFRALPIDDMRREMEAELRRHGQDEHFPPFVAADRGFRFRDDVAVPAGIMERVLGSREENRRNREFCSMRQRIEGMIGQIKSWRVAAEKFRSPNMLFHTDCTLAAAMLAMFVHSEHHHVHA
jgi:hypothetical protein